MEGMVLRKMWFSSAKGRYEVSKWISHKELERYFIVQDCLSFKLDIVQS